VDDKRLIIARRNGDPGNLPKLNGCLLLQLVALIQAIEVEVTQGIDARVWLHAAVEFHHMGRIKLLCVLIDVPEDPHLQVETVIEVSRKKVEERFCVIIALKTNFCGIVSLCS